MIKIIYLIFFIGVIATIASANDKFILSSIEEANSLASKTKQPLLLIFGSESCTYCKLLKQDISSGKLDGSIDRYIVCYIDVNENNNLKDIYNISIIPDSRIIKDNKQVEKIIGYSRTSYEDKIKNVK